MPPAFRFRLRQSHRKSLPVPADIWLYIIQYLDPYGWDKDDIISLASTNKFLRSITLPVLFNTLNLGVPDISEDESRRVYARKVVQRIQGINSSPPILDAICRLTLSGWIIRPDDDRDIDDWVDGYVTDDPNYDAAQWREELREVSQLINDGYREIVTLLSSLPRLYHLECRDCSLIPEIFSYIFRIPNLQSLYIDGYSMCTDDLVRFQATAPSLHVFQYSLNYWSRLSSADAVRLFISLTGQFTVFSFPLNVLTHILADNSLPITLPKLQKLSMFNHDVTAQDNQDDLTCITNFLSLTPNLSELRIVGNIHTETPFIIPDTVIPHLKTLIAPSCIANGIASGRALEKLHILAFSSRNFRGSYTVVSQDIKHVVYNSPLNDPKDLSHLAQVFPRASTVEIMVMEQCTRTFQQLSDVVLSILLRFRHLKQCMVSTVEGRPSDYKCPPSHCPVGRVDDPKYRSHPTLEELHMLSFHRWTWCPKDGWHSVHSGYGADPLYTKTFFKLCIAESEDRLGDKTRGPLRIYPVSTSTAFGPRYMRVYPIRYIESNF